LGRVPASELPSLFAGARALIFPAEEDFGIVPVEAQAAGVPVIAYARGGARDTVVDGVTGVLFEPQTVDGLAAAIVSFEERRWDEDAIRGNARRFERRRFMEGLAREVYDASGNRPPDGIP
jgi:glycosyltransferase involved in cell wall biosynthesis